MSLAELTPNKQIVHFAAKLAGPALEWYGRLPRTQDNNIPWNIEALIQALRTQFAHLNTLYHDYMKFKSTIQGNNSVDTYAAEFQEMLNRTEANMTDTLKVVSFVNGLKNEIQKVMLMQQPCTNLVTAIANAKLIENGLKITDNNKKQVNFLEQNDGQNIGHDILAVLTDKMNRIEMELRKGYDQTTNYKTDKICHYCGRKGHFESECFKKERDI